MALDSQARAGAAGEPSQTEYDAILGTMMASARGRWFLAEYARRNRSADTSAVLAAIDRIGAHLRGEAVPPHAPEYLQLGLMTMAGLIASVETDMTALSAEQGTHLRVTRVVSTLRDLGDCIQVMLDSFRTTEAVAPAPSPDTPVRASAPLTLVETPLAEKPIEQALAAADPTPSLAQEMTPQATVAIAMPEIDYESDFVPFEFEAVEEIASAKPELPAVEPLGPAETAPPHVADHPLAEIRTLTQAELVALFT
jgi:hypothetical protein